MDNSKSISILHLIESREDVSIEINDNIFQLISDNVVSAFEELIQLPSENIDWVDIEIYSDDKITGEVLSIQDMVVKITFVITYFNQQASQYVLDNFGQEATNDNEENVRIITFGFPLLLCDATKSDVIQYILSKTAHNETITTEVTDNLFDLTELSNSQLQSYQLLAHTFSETVH